MKIALIQNNITTGALKANMDALEDAVHTAAAQGAELCVAPEMVLCGPNANDLMLRKSFMRDCRILIQKAAERLGKDPSCPPLLFGAPVPNPAPQGRPVQNCAVLLHENAARVITRKVLIPSNGIHDDARYFEPGAACGVLHHKGWRFAVTIGDDIWNARTFWKDRLGFTFDPVAELIASGGADGLINLTALPFEQGLPSLHQQLLSHLASHYRLPVVAANIVGGNDSFVYYGGSLGFDSNGALLGKAPSFQESILFIDASGRQKGTVAPDLQPEEEIWNATVLGTRDFVRKCGAKSVVIGLSGGVDSALVAAIAADALGKDNVTGILMPSPYSSQGSIDDSLALAKNLGIKTHTLPITPMLEAYRNTFAGLFPEGLCGTPEENVQARIRCALLMAFSNQTGSLVLATGNKSEAAVGYSTLYGDAIGAIAPICDLYKRQIYDLCKWRNTQGSPAIPEAILTKAPSAELRPDQKDSDSLPPYEVLDPLLYEIVEQGESLDRLAEKGFDKETAQKVLLMVRKAEFKRAQSPPVLHLSRRSFCKGWSTPVAEEYASLMIDGE